MDTLLPSRTFRDIYNAATRAAEYPDVCLAAGAVLNAILGTSDYDAEAIYLVTRTKIQKLCVEEAGTMT